MSLLTLSGGSGIGPLPPPWGRTRLASLRTCFGGGVTATTRQLGSVPSWGPEIGMLTDKADRVATYQAHKAAGAEGIYFSVFIHYQEDGVAYPDGIAGWNDFTGNNFAQVAELACECVENQIAPLVQLGGDEKGSQWVIDNIAAIIQALKTSRLGDLTQGYCALVPTFDSNADGDWSDPGDNWAAVNVAIRAQVPDTTALYTWLSNGWARLGTVNLSPEQVQALWKPPWTAGVKSSPVRPIVSFLPHGLRSFLAQSGMRSMGCISRRGPSMPRTGCNTCR